MAKSITDLIGEYVVNESNLKDAIKLIYRNVREAHETGKFGDVALHDVLVIAASLIDHDLSLVSQSVYLNQAWEVAKHDEI